MSLTCAISNESPEQPVVSPVSGCIFEKRLIQKYIADNGVDPINGKDLTEDMLVDVKTTPIVKPRPPSATSIPAILKCLQDEWDAVMLHSFTLRQQLQTARQELSHALYQHDAACRVIARLTKEVTAAREALATLKPQAGIVGAAGMTPMAQPSLSEVGAGPAALDVAAGAAAAAVDESAVAADAAAGGKEEGMSDEVIQKLQDKATVLTADRKKRGKNIPENLMKPDDIRSYKQLASHVGLHSASIPGIMALDVCPTNTAKILTGGNDKQAVVFNKDAEQVVANLQGHQKKVTSVVYHPNENWVFTGSPDTSIRVWGVAQASCAQVIRAHTGPVTGLSLHATGDYLLSSSADEKWAFSDIRTGKVLCKVSDSGSSAALTCAQFHPDGLIFGTGTRDAIVKIWDLKERTNVANFTGHSGPVSALSFSENGYYLATAADDSVIKLWDLRKLKNFKTITLKESYEVKNVCFDQSGTYLAVCGSDIRIYLCKQWQELKVFDDHTASATGVKFGHNARYLVSSSMDRSLKIYGL